MGKTHSKPLAARHGRGTAWAQHAMCESAFKQSSKQYGKMITTTMFDTSCKEGIKVVSPQPKNFTVIFDKIYLQSTVGVYV
jgi:hypothetical protein